MEPSVDTNCNKKEQPEWIEVFKECEPYEDVCIGAGWYSPEGTLPPCGASAYAIACIKDEKGGCSAGEETLRKQRCR